MKIRIAGLTAACGAILFAGTAAAVEVQPLLAKLRAVEPNGAGHREATKAWAELVQADAAQLPEILAGLDSAGPLAANWIRTAVDAIAERQCKRGQLPAGDLERFVRDTRHAPRARRLAYEWLLRVDPAAEQRLVPEMLNDPSTELRRDAVARLIEKADAAATAGNRAEAVSLYKNAFAASRDLGQVDLLAKQLNKHGEKADVARHLGLVMQWKLIGPFDNADEKGFDIAYPPEKEAKFDAAYPGLGGEVRWVDFTSQDEQGKIDFNKALGEKKSVVGYAAAEFQSSRQQPAELRLSSECAVRVWLNGKDVGQFKLYHGGSQPDQYVCPVVLQPGRNLILVKVCQNNMPQDWAKPWDLRLRVCDATGGAVQSEGGQP